MTKCFYSGHIIQDNILIAHAVFHYLNYKKKKKRKSGQLCIKSGYAKNLLQGQLVFFGGRFVKNGV